MALNFLNNGYFAGKVGIGIQSPAAKLHVNPTTTDEIAIAINGTQNYSAGEFQRIAAGDASSINRLSIGFGYDSPTDWAIRYSSYGRHEFYTGNDWGNAANTEKMVITSSGSVGIGTGSPGTKLEVVADVAKGVLINRTYTTSSQSLANVRAYYGLAITPLRGGTGGLYFTNYDADTPIIQSVNTSDVAQFLLLNPLGGNVGIGTTSPDTKLHIVGPDGPVNPPNYSVFDVTIENVGQSDLGIIGTTYSGIYFGDAATPLAGAVVYQHSDDSLTLRTGGNAHRVTVSGAGAVKFNNYNSTNNTGTPTYILGTTNGGDIVKVLGADIPGVPGGSGTLNTVPLWTPDGDTLGNSHITQNTNDIFIPRYLGHTGDGNNYIGFPANDVFNITTAGVQRFRVNADGNIGIGTTSPDGNLEVVTSTIVSGASDTVNNVLIGLQAADRPTIILDTADTTYTNRTWNITNVGSAGKLFIGRNGLDVMVMDNSGNVGIGTTSPSEALNIGNNGQLRFDGNASGKGIVASSNGSNQTFSITRQDGVNVGDLSISAYSGIGLTGNRSSSPATSAYALYVKSDGNVGIGTTSPTQKLNVVNNNTATWTAKFTNNTNNVYLSVNDANNYGIYVAGETKNYFSGNVGIGTTSPTAKLHVVGTGLFTGLVSGITPVAAANFVTKAYVDGSGGGTGPFLPLAGGTMTGTNGVLMPDNFRLKFGDATTPDLEIFHNGSNSYVRDSGTGGLVLEGSTMLELKARSGELYLRGNENSSVQLYHNNNLKLNTANTGVAVTGDINIDSALLSNQENTDVDTGAEVVASVAIATYTAAFFDFVIKKGLNVRSGTVYACHDGDTTPLVQFTETSTQDLGDTSDVTLSVDISGGNMRLLATTTSDDWSVKSLIRAI